MNSKFSSPARVLRASLFWLWIASFPAGLAAQSTPRGTYYLFPRFITCGSQNSGIAVMNPNSWEVVVTLNMTQGDGTAGPTATIKVPALGQIAKAASQLFGGDCLDASLEVSSLTSGLIVYYQAFDSEATYLDGAEAPITGMDLIFPIIPGWAEGLAEIDFLNWNARTTAVELGLWSLSGNLLGKAKIQVPPGGVYRNLANDVFPPGTDLYSASHITAAAKPLNLLSQAQAVSGTSLFAGFSSVASGGNVDLAALNALTLDQVSNSGVVPFFRTGTNYTSTLTLANAEPAAVDVNLSAIGNDGTSLGSRKVSLKGNGGYRAPLQSVFSSLGFGEREGWIMVQASGRVFAALIHGRSDAASLSVVPLQKTPATSFIFPQVAQGNGYSSEITLVNPSSAPSAADVLVIRPEGVTAASNQIELAPGAKATRRLDQLVPEIGSQSGGFVYVRSKGALYSTFSVATDNGATIASFTPQLVLVSYSPAPLKSFAVTGKVMLNDRPAGGFRLVLSGPTGKLTTSGADGTYAFTDLPAGKYSMTIDQFGFEFVPAQINFELITASKRQDFQGYTAANAIVVQPASMPVGSPDTNATIFGSNFNSSSQAYVGAARLKTTYVDSSQLNAVIPAYMMAAASRFDIFVVTNDLSPDRRVSQTYPFVAYQTKPTLSGISTSGNIVEGSPGATITLNGKGFLKDAKVKVNGVSDDIQVNILSDTQIVALLPARYLARGGIFPVTVENAYPANTESNIQLLTVFYPAPAIDLISPPAVPARLETGAGPLTLEVLGYGFRRGAIVLFKGKPLATTYCENDQYCLSVHLYAKVPANELRQSGFAEIVVQNPDPSLAASQAVFMRIDGLEPTISSVVPGTATIMNLSDKFVMPILVTGANFGPQTQIRIYKAGTPPPKFENPDQILSSMQLYKDLKDVNYGSLGEWKVQVLNPQPGGGQSAEISFLITEGVFSGNPFLVSLNPGFVAAGGPGFTLTINGTNLRNGAQVQFNMAFLAATVVSDKQIIVDVPAYLIEMPGRVPISVVNPDTGGASNRLFLDIR